MSSQSVNQVIDYMSNQYQRIFPNGPSPVVTVSAAVAASTLAWSLARPSKKRPANAPPLVPHYIPYIGNGLELQRDPAAFIKRCKEQYGPVFEIMAFGRKQVVLTGEYILECFRAGDSYLDFNAGVEDSLPLSRILALSYDKQERKTGPSYDNSKSPLVRAIRNNFKTHQLDKYQERIEYAVNRGLDLDITFEQGKDTTVLDMSSVQRMIGRISALIFAGDEIGENEELIEAMATFAQSIISSAIAYMVFPIYVADTIVKRYLSIGPHIEIIMRYMTPVLSKIQKKEEEEGQQLQPTFFMHNVMHTPNPDGTMQTAQEAAFTLQDVTFASIHTTSTFSILALHTLSDRPDLQVKIRQELEKAKQQLGEITPGNIKNIPIMDSFFREILRINSDYIGIHHKALQDTMLSNGIVIPKGSSVGLAANDAHTDPGIQELGPNNIPLIEVDPERFITRKTKKSTAIGLDMLAFGVGYHACPGRYLASQEITYVIAKILEQYDISPITSNGMRAPNRLALGIMQLVPAQGVKLTKRK
ncbi:hypothetical protein INT43_000491, partial [Umbelopsis isabellina]